ncbi:MAG: PolC-type DNA polymerase III [Eubacteriales bacterium]
MTYLKETSIVDMIKEYNLDIVKVEVDAVQYKWIIYINGTVDFDEKFFKNVLLNRIKALKKIEIRSYGHNHMHIIDNHKDKMIQLIRSIHSNIFLPKNNWIIKLNRVIIPIMLKEDFLRIQESDIVIKLENLLREQTGCNFIVEFNYEEKEHAVKKEIEKEKSLTQQNLSLVEKKPNKIFGTEVILGKKIKEEGKSIISCFNDDSAIIEGFAFEINCRELRNNKILISFHISDYTSSVTVKIFIPKDKKQSLLQRLQDAHWLKIKGRIQYDTFAKENVMMADSIVEYPKEKRSDNALIKRIELHQHTQYSSMDCVAKIPKIIDKAVEFGHKAVVITDHGVLQGYPDAMEYSKNKDIKIIYGVEGYLVDDHKSSKWGNKEGTLDDTFIVFDIETTGLSCKNNEIIEIAAVKVRNHQIIETFTSFVKPKRSIPVRITEITGITNDMVQNENTIHKILPKFLNFCQDHFLVAHNARFDMSFLNNAANQLGLHREHSVIDTLALSRNAISDLTRHNLKALANYYKIKIEHHHRALDDAIATAKIFIQLLKACEEKGAHCVDDINEIFDNERAIQKMDTHHVIILVKNAIGLKNLYQLVSESHIKYFYKKPRIPKSALTKYREGLIIGSACENSEVYRSILNEIPEEDMHDIVQFYDYLEVQPLGNNQFMIDNHTVNGIDDLIRINKKIIELGDVHHKPVVATGDVHFVEKEDEYFRRILMHGQGYEDAEKQAPLYYRTTQEMLEEFYYLDPEKAEEIVIHNTNKIADEIKEVIPIPSGTFPPIIPGSDDEISKMVLSNAYKKYGNPLPQIVQERIDIELNSIIKNGYSVLYLVAHKLVNKSLEDGYLVGSRGSVGSSLVATFCNITEVNPLQPHYICSHCKNVEFFDSNDVGVGPDLPDKNCPVCNTKYDKDGFDIPFEVFLGFDGDKEPDIDLNFSGEYQIIAHKYTEELFGQGKVFRAGTISTIAERTAYGFVLNYLEERNKPFTSAEVSRLIKGCSGIKKTTGQHPGGIMVVPQDKEIFDFCPIQKPADDLDTEIVTTHFDYHSISGRLLKLDILGHDDPTVIRMLEDITGLDAKLIPLDDAETMSIFTNNEALKLQDKEIGTQIGTYGIPEFGTTFVREMLTTTNPTAFADLIRISGLSHGTDVWLNNAQTLIQQNIATIKDVICTRDDIMVYLLYMGLPAKNAFSIMEKVRKGKGLAESDIALMQENNVPQWYIDSCNKIKYMFPKAHAVAYVTMAFRIAFFKVYYPLAYYATYFTVRADDFDAHIAIQGKTVVRKKIVEIKEKGNNASAKEKSTLTVLELILEMLCRGFDFIPVQLMESHHNKFIIKGNRLLPPFNALEGIGDKASFSLYKSREYGGFLSLEDLQKRAKLSKTNIEILEKHGVINFLPQSNQISLF